ncbi:hypothetical protein DPMN_081493 [Dreissena polymorpha]|uniref:Uncharacterized protein n=1 Tax=Dreissena polymorpha TaxID=45954 RepID=A0A9D3Y943_DREPO|nr:hypothetical protein DPMN_081493 [Dreissena polymorpha]
MEAVRCFTANRQDSWDVNLPQIAGALRSSVNRSTGFTQNKMMLGREVYSPADLVFPSQKITFPTESEYVYRLEDSIKNAHD